MTKTNMFKRTFYWLRKQGASGSVFGGILKLADKILSNPFAQTIFLTVYSILITIVTSYYGNQCFKSISFWVTMGAFALYIVIVFVNRKIGQKAIEF